MLATLNSTFIGRGLVRVWNTHWTSMPSDPIASVSERLNCAIPISTKTKFMDIVPIPAGRVTFIPEAISARARKKP